jgi:hypothetical protein
VQVLGRTESSSLLQLKQRLANFNVTINEKQHKQQITTFNDQSPSYDYAVGSMEDTTFDNVYAGDASLENFFSRPVKVATYSWGVGADFFQEFDPWSFYFENPRVINRICNFNLLKCKLCVKFVVNGNGFHYGRILASYLPLPNNDNFSTTRALISQDLIGMSQRPKIFIDPTNSSGGTLCLPFFWYNNYMDIPQQDWRDMGKVSLKSFGPLKHANGADDNVNIAVFVWAEDVSLAAPTSSEPGALSPQMGKADEYGKGPISRPASIIARAAGALKNAPYIGLYARATEMAANAVSGIATVFGYSRPNNIGTIQYYKAIPLGNAANTNVEDTAQKLSVDAKQELTIDSRTVGLSGDDEMAIDTIATRESYLTQFVWATAAAPEQFLFQCLVTPALWDITGDEVHFPACAFAAMPFENFYGSMNFRFQIVASNYHKGRLKIVYDPYGFASNEYITNYTYVLDLAEEKDVTITIGWGSDKPYCVCRFPGNTSGLPINSLPFTTVATGTTPRNNANGVIRVYCVNELVTPNSTVNNDVKVNVYVSCGDDMQFRKPVNTIESYTFFADPGASPTQFEPQMAEPQVKMDQEDTTQPDKPDSQDTDMTMLQKVSTQDAYSHVFFGEEIMSFRQLLKRYCAHRCVPRTSGGNGYWLIRQDIFPLYRGFAPGALTSVDGGANRYNYGYNTLMNYLTPAFSGWRGGIKWKTSMTEPHPTENKMYAAYRDNGTYKDSTVGITSATKNFDVYGRFPGTFSGASITNRGVMPALEVEVPFYSNLRFYPAKLADKTTAQSFDQAWTVVADVDQDVTGNYYQDFHVAAGEDFTLFFFTGAPRMYLNRVPTDA